MSLDTYPVRTPDQLSALLRAFRKETGLTQGELARRLGVTQQTYSALERNAANIGAARLLSMLNVLGVEMRLGRPGPSATVLHTAERDSPAW